MLMNFDAVWGSSTYSSYSEKLVCNSQEASKENIAHVSTVSCFRPTHRTTTTTSSRIDHGPTCVHHDTAGHHWSHHASICTNPFCLNVHIATDLHVIHHMVAWSHGSLFCLFSVVNQSPLFFYPQPYLTAYQLHMDLYRLGMEMRILHHEGCLEEKWWWRKTLKNK